jgi:hypothetical protein
MKNVKAENYKIMIPSFTPWIDAFVRQDDPFWARLWFGC